MNKIRIMALGSAAFLLLAGAANAGPSTPAERAETRALNMQQAQAAPAEAVRTADASPIMIAGKTQADEIAPVTITPLLVAQNDVAPAMAPMALNSMSNPPDKIATARVVDDKGVTVGAVQKVDIQGGKPSDVEIALLGSQQVVALDAGKLSYDASSNVVTAALDKSQIVQLPPAG